MGRNSDTAHRMGAPPDCESVVAMAEDRVSVTASAEPSEYDGDFWYPPIPSYNARRRAIADVLQAGIAAYIIAFWSHWEGEGRFLEMQHSHPIRIPI